MTELELYHHGVKGMRWGVRKKIEQKRKASNEVIYEKHKAKAQQKLDEATTDRAKAKAQKDVDRLAKADAQAYGNRIRNERKIKARIAAYAGLKIYSFAKSPQGKMMIAAGKQAVQKTMNNIGDRFFDYSILDATGKTIRRFN